MKRATLHLLILICAATLLNGCQKYPENPNRPILPYPITIYPNQMQYQQLHTIGGWEYITSEMERMEKRSKKQYEQAKSAHYKHQAKKTKQMIKKDKRHAERMRRRQRSNPFFS